MSCKICDYVTGKVKTKKLYEDENILAILNPTPVTFGHSLIFPKNHHILIQQIPEEVFKKMFFIAQQISGIIFEATGAEGSNIVISEGVVAGQKHAHAIIHIIPRKKDDGLNFEWAQKQIPEEYMEKIFGLLKVPQNNENFQEKQKTEEITATKQEEPEKEKKEDYRIRHLRRIP
ncbi:MAG: HIT family protein [Candidatus Woesearchaeota archaeon]